MDSTENLALPYLAAAQAQKHVTHNEALRMLDALVQLSVASATMSAPPPSPAAGRRYIVPAGATGAFVGQIGKIAAWQDGGWVFYAPKQGWLVHVADSGQLLVHDGAAFVAAVAPPAQLPTFGVNATADAQNRLAVASASTLFNHAGSHHRLSINKAAATDTAAVIFQTGFSGRAEIGATGDDDFHFKVSANGCVWREALTLVAAAGVPRLPALAKAALPAAAAAGAGALVHVTDEAGGAVTAFSDGTNWRRVTDRAIVS
jgi:hypothetical protein